MTRCYLPRLLLAVGLVMTSCGGKQNESQTSGTQANMAPASAPGLVPTSSTEPSLEKARKAIEQVTVIISQVKRWKERGHSYKNLSLKVAVANGLLPKEMIGSSGVVVNPWGGPVAIDAAPASTGDTFLILFSGVPKEDCVQVSFPPNDLIKIYAGNFTDTNVPASAEQAKALCTTGNIWFVSK